MLLTLEVGPTTGMLPTEMRSSTCKSTSGAFDEVKGDNNYYTQVPSKTLRLPDNNISYDSLDGIRYF